MAGNGWRRWVRGCRWAFRACRWLVWALLGVLVAALWYLDRVGLPEMLKRPLQERVRRHGLELEFARLRLRWFAGILADQVKVRPLGTPDAPQLEADHVRLDLQLRDLWRGRWEVEGLEVVQGRFASVAGGDDRRDFPWDVEGLNLRIRFLPGDTWRVEEARAVLGPVRCRISGVLSNATALRQWSGWKGLRRSGEGDSRDGAGQALDWRSWLGRTTFSASPEMVGTFEGDGRAPEQLRLRWQMRIPAVATPAGTAHGLLLRVSTDPGAEGTGVGWTVDAEADRLWTGSADCEGAKATIRFEPDAPGHRWTATGTVRLAGVSTRWGTAGGVQVGFEAAGNPRPWSVDEVAWRLEAGDVDGGDFSAHDLRWEGRLLRSSGPRATVQVEPWRQWTGWQLSNGVAVGRLHVLGVGLRSVRGVLEWSPPELRVHDLAVVLPSGAVEGEVLVHAATHRGEFRVRSEADPRDLDAWLSERTKRWLDQFQWEQPPLVEMEGELALPPWPPTREQWAVALRENLTLTGTVSLGRGSFRGFTATRARSGFRYAAGTWHLPDLEVERPDGWLRADYRVRPWQRDYEWHFRFELPPDAFVPLLHTNQLQWLPLVRWDGPLEVEGEARGEFLRPETVNGQARVRWTNFVFRGVPVRRLETTVVYSNPWVLFLEPRVERAGGWLKADGVALDLVGQRVHFTNAVCLDDPDTIAAAIGPKTARTLAPYHFERPPEIRLEGTVPWHGHDGADLRVEVSGGPFRWWRFRTDRVTGTIRWQGETVGLTNVTAPFYGGELSGWGVFDLSPPEGTGVRFGIGVRRVNMAALMQDLNRAPSRLEGLLDADLWVDSGNTRDWQTWNGRGRASLRDGWIWSIPLFGVLSEPLDSLVPGLGRSPVSSGRASFVLTNGMVVSDDLECRASTMRLLYRGQVALDGRVDAVVQAELLRDAWLVGRVLSLALWPVSKIFEFHITGTLSQPRAEPLHIPRVLTIPLRPWQTLRGVFEPAPSGQGPP